MRSMTTLLVLFAASIIGVSAKEAPANAPNILFIAVDDLNDWIGCLGGHPQAATPNFDRLAASGVLFDNAHCPAPACNPSRSAIMTGRSPHTSGFYAQRQKMRDVMPDAELIPKHFSKHGYWSAGSGKMLHYYIDAQSWDVYYPKKEGENPFPRTLYPEKRPVNLPVGGPWQYKETDWGGLDATDEEFGGDWLVSKWIGEQLARDHDKPFFLACGLYRPHEPWFVPQKYFDAFPLGDIQLPPGYREDDLDDVPPGGKRRAMSPYFPHIRKHGQWKQGVQGYLASIAFADAMLGRVLDSLQNSAHRDNTIVVLWSDHGWHLGEKQHWQKFTPWRVCTRVPLMIRVPKGTVGLPEGTTAGTVCKAPVNLLSLYPTLTELAGVPKKETNDGPSLVPLLKDAGSDWPHVSITHLEHANSFGLSDDRWRYIRHHGGDEELYDIQTDRYELTNLATHPQHQDQLQRLRDLAPKTFAKMPAPKIKPRSKAEWTPADLAKIAKAEWNAPASKPAGLSFLLTFSTKRADTTKLFWINQEGEPRPYGAFEPGKGKGINTRVGAVWLATDGDEKPLGYFKIKKPVARAIVP